MKYLCAIVALLCCVFMVFVCVAESFAAPNAPLPSPMVPDRLFAACSIVCCVAAFKRLIPATVGLWTLVVVDAVQFWLVDNPRHYFSGMWSVGAIAAAFLTLAIVAERFKLIPD